MSDAPEKAYAKMEDIPTMIIVSRAKDYVDSLHSQSADSKFSKMRFSAPFALELNKKVAELVRHAMERARSNGRATLNRYDL